MHKDQAHKDQAHKDRAHKDRAHKDRAHSLNSKMEKNEDFLKWTKISEVFPNLSPGEKVRTLDHFKNSNDMDIREFNIFQPGDQGLGHSSIINPGSIKNEDDTMSMILIFKHIIYHRKFEINISINSFEIYFKPRMC